MSRYMFCGIDVSMTMIFLLGLLCLVNYPLLTLLILFEILLFKIDLCMYIGVILSEADFVYISRTNQHLKMIQ